VAAVSSALVVAVFVGGWVVQDHYLERRYVRAGLSLDATNARFRDISHRRVAVFGTEALYPMFGLDLSNRVSKVHGPGPGSPVEQCRGWRRILTKGGYRYVVLAREPFTDFGPDEEWVDRDSATTQVGRDGTTVVYRIDGPLDPETCA
jgi:hypothetical protein